MNFIFLQLQTQLYRKRQPLLYGGGWYRNVFYIIRIDVLSCRNYYASKKSVWTSTSGCNLGM